VRIYTDLEGLLTSDPGTVDARKVKWIGALRTLGVTATATDDAIDVDFRARTEGDVSDEDLPIAPGDETHAGDHGRLVDVETGAAGIEDFHRSLLCRAAGVGRPSRGL
jgi:hypothetical protein